MTDIIDNQLPRELMCLLESSDVAIEDKLALLRRERSRQNES